MKKHCYLILLLVLILSRCGDLLPATLTITNNCTNHVSVTIEYSSTDINGEKENNYDSIELEPGETDTVEIHIAGDAHVTVKAFNGIKYTSFSYYGSDKEIIMTDDDFI